MNKAFTANINDQVTARGYLDENNQLIMLEPEGSGGGGSDFTTATITIEGFGSAPTGTAFRCLICIDTEYDELYANTVLPDGTYDILLYKGSQNCNISETFGSNSQRITVTGDYADGIITGDLTVTLAA